MEDDVVDLKLGNRATYTKTGLSVDNVVGKPIVVSKISFEKTAFGDKEIMIMETDVGIVKTGSAVLIRQAKEVILPILSQGKKARVVITQKQGKGWKKYYTFE